MAHQTLHEYYRREDFLPTYGRFQSAGDLAEHALHRRRLFTDKLFLPPRLFQGARLIEFGPDSGENSLVFAQWGARCTLVEPNPNAHPQIRDYFERFGLKDRLAHLDGRDLAAFAATPLVSGETYDIVDAEGFIYTVRPESLWIDLFARLLADDGLVILFYYEHFGGFMELLLKAIHACMRRTTGMGALESAQALFAAKWDSIAHKRTLQAWVMDVLENPFVRLEYFLDARSLCDRLHQAGLHLYSSWPPYRDGLDVHWFKRVPSLEEVRKGEGAFIARSRLSHLCGRKLFLIEQDESLEAELNPLLTAVDALIDDTDRAALEACREALSRVSERLQSARILADPQDIAETLALIGSLERILQFLSTDATAELAAFCAADRAFLHFWGMPSHFAVFRKGPTASEAGAC